MQYLSKAYSYYSGINPATLSGAIDVIVVRHVDSEGNVTLSSSPFHVRFGKLQVLRAAEKRVTIRLPNNLPQPHVAPFSMKVGDTGEAFFVVETDEQVPEDLLTSPVVMPTETELPPTPPLSEEAQDSGEEQQGEYATQEPFGQTEQKAPQEERLPEVDFLDLDATPETSKDAENGNTNGKTQSDSSGGSILGSAASVLPSLSSSRLPSPMRKSAKATTQSDGTNDEVKSKRHDHQIVSTTTKQPNPVEARPGDKAGLPAVDHKLDSIMTGQSAASAEDSLPKVHPGQGEGPEVLYGRDVVLDMDGYHSSKNGVDCQDEHEPSVEMFIQDLLASVQPTMDLRPKPTKSRSADDEIPSAMLDADEQITPVETPTETTPEVDLDLPASLSTMGINSGRPIPGRLDRGQSEPPHLQNDFSKSPDTSRAKAAMEMEWDWDRRRGLDLDTDSRPQSQQLGKLKNVEENPYMFVLEVDHRTHTFELSLCENFGENATEASKEATFVKNRLTFQTFIENPRVVDEPGIVVRYDDLYFTWSTGYRLLYALAMYRRTLVPPSASLSNPTLPALSDLGGVGGTVPARGGGYEWSRWWRRGQSSGQEQSGRSETAPATSTPVSNSPAPGPQQGESATEQPTAGEGAKHWAKTLRLSSDQLEQLHLKPGPNTIQFSVTSSYSGLATCTSRIFLWENTDQIVISDIDGTITKSDALGHVFAAIGRDWTHLGIAKLYTDICNNGYKIMYLTSRAIGQADTTREYLKSIAQGSYRMPEGPVLMSPDRLMASLHREVIMRKPELFKMACLRDIQRLFGPQAKEAFYAGFGNRITDAMSYRSVGIEASKIYTIDSTGVVKTELLSAAGHKGSYIQLNDLVNEVFPVVSTKVKPEYTDSNYWREPIPDIPLPDLTPPSPTLSARSDTSGRLSVLGKIAGMGRRSSRSTIHAGGRPGHQRGQSIGASVTSGDPSSRPSSPLIAPSLTSDDVSEVEYEDDYESRDGDLVEQRRENGGSGGRSISSMPGSFEDREGRHLNEEFFANRRPYKGTNQEGQYTQEEGDVSLREDDGEEDDDVRRRDYDDDDAIFDDDILAAGEMQHVPF